MYLQEQFQRQHRYQLKYDLFDVFVIVWKFIETCKIFSESNSFDISSKILLYIIDFELPSARGGPL